SFWTLALCLREEAARIGRQQLIDHLIGDPAVCESGQEVGEDVGVGPKVHLHFDWGVELRHFWWADLGGPNAALMVLRKAQLVLIALRQQLRDELDALFFGCQHGDTDAVNTYEGPAPGDRFEVGHVGFLVLMADQASSQVCALGRQKVLYYV